LLKDFFFNLFQYWKIFFLPGAAPLLFTVSPAATGPPTAAAAAATWMAPKNLRF
jgi:hypothetical protein